MTKMKPLIQQATTILLAIGILSMSACDSNETPQPQANFEVLGITSVSINQQPIAVKPDAALETSAISTMVLTSMTYHQNIRVAKYCYTILCPGDITPSVAVATTFPDTSITTEKEVLQGGQTSITVLIQRTGHPEQIEYEFVFFTLKKEQ